MRECSNRYRLCALLFILPVLAFAVGGCSRTKYRVEADRDAYEAISERVVDPRWSNANYNIEMDPRFIEIKNLKKIETKYKTGLKMR